MCGIFGYIGEKPCASLLLEGLRRLEYRGYDSAGMAVLAPTLSIIKAKGQIAELAKKLKSTTPTGTIGIAHTRWATHGEPNEQNAHPHTCTHERIAVVHNGIIENYHALREYLKEKGHHFQSDTDSEVLAHLIGHFAKDEPDFFIAVQQALSEVEGAYGIAAIKEGRDEIIVARNGSPLILGIGDGEYFVSSDHTAINDHTKDIICLEDKDIARLTREGYTIIDMHNKEIHRDVEKITWDIHKIQLSGHDHFMHKEIIEQPETVANAFRGRLGKTAVKLDGLEEFKDFPFTRIRILACGTSYYAGLIGKYLFEENARIPTEVDYASEFRYRNPILSSDELVIAISQSGETADTLEAIRLAKKSTATFGIVNVVGSTIARQTKAGIYIHAGPEIGVASTKAFTGQVTCLYLLAIELRRRTHPADYLSRREELLAIPEKIKEILSHEEDIKAISKVYARHDNALYLGRGLNYPVALEGALKLKEISGIHAEGYPAAEMKHGPIALIDENMPVVFIATGDEVNYEKVLSNMAEVKARKGKIIAIASKNDIRLTKLADHIILVPKTTECLSPLLNVIPLQLLAYHMAVLRGKNPDRPQNLAKAVTVE
jgi:glucosamine--fructose-6-phosphate aminotransferase (isomerizing)